MAALHCLRLSSSSSCAEPERSPHLELFAVRPNPFGVELGFLALRLSGSGLYRLWPIDSHRLHLSHSIDRLRCCVRNAAARLMQYAFQHKTGRAICPSRWVHPMLMESESVKAYDVS